MNINNLSPVYLKMKNMLFRKSTACLALFIVLLFVLWSPLLKQSGMTISSADNLLLYPPFNDSYKGYFPYNTLLNDQFTQFYPWMAFNHNEIVRNKRFPLWNPHQEMGIPHWANTQNAALSIQHLPVYFFSLEKALNIRAFFTVFFAFWGCFLFFRLLSKDYLMAFIGAMAFALGGFIMVWLGHPHSGVAMWLGWLFWAFFRLFKKPSVRRMVYLSIFLFLSYLGGHIETAFHNVIILSAFAVVFLLLERSRPPKKRVYIFFLFIMAGIISFFLAAIYFFPFIEYLLRSWTYFARREMIPAGGAGHSFVYLLNFFAPDIFGNPTQQLWLVPQLGANYNEVNGGFFTFSLLVMVLPGLILAGKINRSVRLATFFLFFLCFSFVYRVPVLNYFLNNLPLLNVGVNMRFVYGIGFMGITLGIMGWKEIIENKRKPLFFLLVIFTVDFIGFSFLGLILI